MLDVQLSHSLISDIYGTDDVYPHTLLFVTFAFLGSRKRENYRGGNRTSSRIKNY